MKLPLKFCHSRVLIGASILLLFLYSCSPLRLYPEGDRAWAIPEIEAFERLDKTKSYDDNSILFVGSSSIRLWKTLEKDMDPYAVIQRGYGGAHFRDLVFFTDRILADHDLKMVVCFIANDISGSPKDSSPKEVLQLFKVFVNQIREKHPDLPILQIAVTPTPSRWHLWSKISQVNSLLEDYCTSQQNLYFINTVPHFLDEKGQPKPEWFVKDQLHLNATGYTEWNTIIKAEVERVLSLP